MNSETKPNELQPQQVREKFDVKSGAWAFQTFHTIGLEKPKKSPPEKGGEKLQTPSK